ncbi:hypothetical protein PYR67_16320 [Rhizobium sp. BC49]|nr:MULTISPECIES: hypothetical protein [Rhizobium]MDF0660896.1 hypothetical protein [Rhizobium sp. BC49]ULJ81299.1 hypothetical protein MF410_24810 [Rhizobium sp. C104]
MIVDDKALRVGSSNFNNRSMLFDTNVTLHLRLGKPSNYRADWSTYAIFSWRNTSALIRMKWLRRFDARSRLLQPSSKTYAQRGSTRKRANPGPLWHPGDIRPGGMAGG